MSYDDSAFSYRVPAENWKPEGWTPPKDATKSMITQNHVHIDQALKTPSSISFGLSYALMLQRNWSNWCCKNDDNL